MWNGDIMLSSANHCMLTWYTLIGRDSKTMISPFDTSFSAFEVMIFQPFVFVCS